jgi:hypothetical protein
MTTRPTYQATTYERSFLSSRPTHQSTYFWHAGGNQWAITEDRK